MLAISSASSVSELAAGSSITPAPSNTAAVLPKDELEEPQEANFIDHEFFNSLPIGYRFLPKDEELINQYLIKKISGQALPTNKIVDVNLYQYNPETVIEKYRPCGEREWYFFTPRDRKYKNGERPNRAAGDGFWKATGADKAVQSLDGVVIGYRKALVFYRGKQHKQDGIKTNWIMHEYRVNPSTVELPPRVSRGDNDMRLDDYVLCRIYRKPGRSSDYKQPRKRENNCAAADADVDVDASLQQLDDHVSEPATSAVNHGCQTSHHPMAMDTGTESDSKRPPHSENSADNFSLHRPDHDPEAGMRSSNHGFQNHFPMAMESDYRQPPQRENRFAGNISFHHGYQQTENSFLGNILFQQPGYYSEPGTSSLNHGYQQTVHPMAMADGTSSLLQHPYSHLHHPLPSISSNLPMDPMAMADASSLRRSSYYPPTQALRPLDDFNSMWKIPYGLGPDPLVNFESEWIHDDDKVDPFAHPMSKR